MTERQTVAVYAVVFVAVVIFNVFAWRWYLAHTWN